MERPFSVPFWLVLLLLNCPLLSEGPRPPFQLDSEARRWVDDLLADMSLEEQVGQLIVGGTDTRFTNLETPKFQEIRANIKRFHLGGYHAFGGEIYSASVLIRRMQELSKLPLLITSDLEGGTGLILRGGTRFPKAMALGATFDPDLVRQVARITAQEASALGIHITFSPVADVNNNPLNPIINIRSFGEDPQQVARMTAAYVEGIQQGGLLATAKHFPGHGDTATNSHTGLPAIKVSRQRLEQVELVPFRAAIQAGVSGIMVAHMVVPALDPRRGVPATLSSPVLTGLLRQEMGFQGLVFTDAMNMGALEAFGIGEASVRAFEAGADVILYPSSIAVTFEALIQAVRQGRITPLRLQTSVRRILEAKAQLGLHRSPPADLMGIDTSVGGAQARKVSQTIMDRAITLVRDERNEMPFHLAPMKRVLLLTVLDERRPRESRGEALVREFRRRHRRLRHIEVLPETPVGGIQLQPETLAGIDYVLVAVYVRVAAEKESLEISPQQLELLAALSELKRPVALAIFGSPYLLSTPQQFRCVLLAYDDHPQAELAVVRAVLGDMPFSGRLPVSLSDSLPAGYRLQK